MRNIFDSHAHYDDEKFDTDRDELLSALPDRGVRAVMCAAVTLDSSRQCREIAGRYGYIFCSAGVHPHEAADAPEDMEAQIRELTKTTPKLKALGEMGLDYHYDFSPREKQREVFERQLILAKELDLPVIIHDREAHQDTMELLRKHRPKGIVHCYSGSAEMARELLSLGLYIGFTGMLTFPNSKKAAEAVKAIPTDRLLVETDCPYMAPVPFRGKRSDSSMIAETVVAMALLKEVSPQEMLDITFENACRVYQIDSASM